MAGKKDPLADVISHYGAKSFLGIQMFALLQVSVWLVLAVFIKEGWWWLPINIIFFIFTAVSIGLGTWQTLKLSMPSKPAFLLGSFIYFVWVMLIRSYLLGIFLPE